MDILPFEVLSDVLEHLPRPSQKAARLTSRRFNAALSKPSFQVLASFIDPTVAVATIEVVAADLRLRPRSIWSPRCLVPAGLPIPESFLLAMHVALKGDSWTGAALSRRDSSSSTRSAWSSSSSTDGSLEWDAGCSDASGDSSDDYQSEDGDAGRITVHSLGQAVGRRDITEDVLRQAMFRYALYMSYVYEGEGKAPQLWVFNPSVWADRT